MKALLLELCCFSPPSTLPQAPCPGMGGLVCGHPSGRGLSSANLHHCSTWTLAPPHALPPLSVMAGSLLCMRQRAWVGTCLSKKDCLVGLRQVEA